MSRFQSQDSQLNQKDDFLINPPPTQPNYENPSSSSSSAGRVSPVLLLIIVILAVIFFISGLVHLLFRFFMKKKLPSTSILFHSNRYTDTSGGSHAIQRQLQQLFRLHDSGLDQTSIDSLPVFLYKDIIGLNEPLDCAVCLCEFSCHDKLRLLPICSHAFHIKCIDTWLLSNSTCPLCRGTLLSSGLPMQIPVFNFDDSIELSSGCVGDGENGVSWGEKRVFSVRLGKFRSLNDDGGGYGEASRCNLDARRCYSMGSFQYVVGDSYLQVTLSPDSGGGGVNFAKVRGQNGNSKVDGDVEGKKISSMTRGESFSVSKIWLWSKKSKLPSYSDSYNMGVFPVSLDKDLPFTYI